MKLQLPDSVCSRQDVAALLVDVQAYVRWYYHVTIKKRLKLRGASEQPDISPAARELIQDWSIKKPLSLKSLDELISALKSFKDAAPTLDITLAAPATKNLKKSLVTWCRKNIEPDVLVTFKFDSTLLGGMVVRYGSHIFDWSFRRQILASRDKFPEILRHVR